MRNGIVKKVRISIFCLALSTIAFLLSSCGYFSSADNREKLRSLSVGMTKQEVIKIMGEPNKNEVYNTPDIWFYYTNPKWSDGAVTRDECTPLVFENDRLAGWGSDYYKVNYEFKDWSEKAIKEEE
ncbi:MAG: hypothetical protein A2X49_08375 [Lentisphaerae bacterium GWF2_52_8]|nr:MAG: hypothetical protein A2X49_08375 [Lentisphaerae bacterium GWF2_52_8]